MNPVHALPPSYDPELAAAFVAHALLAPERLAPLLTRGLVPDVRALLAVIQADPAAVRAAGLTTVADVAGCSATALRLAARAERLRVHDLALAGPFDTLARLLGARARTVAPKRRAAWERHLALATDVSAPSTAPEDDAA